MVVEPLRIEFSLLDHKHVQSAGQQKEDSMGVSLMGFLGQL